MSTSTALDDLAGIKHALELGLLLAALVLAAAAHGDTRLAPDFIAATGNVLSAQATKLGLLQGRAGTDSSCLTAKAWALRLG
jgi:hypothetical protein